MGNQVNVLAADLLKAGCTLVPNRAVYPSHLPDEPAEVVDYLSVVFPGAGCATSYCIDMLVFDCRSKESQLYWVKEWLIKNNVNFVEG
jgi:hypothetical protein